MGSVLLPIIAFGGSLKWRPRNLIVSGYLKKVLYEMPTPLTSAIVNRLKRAEGLDPTARADTLRVW